MTDTTIVRVGGWLFRHRTAIPVPLAVLLLVVPSSSPSPALRWAGVGLLASGEALRLLAVRQIGAVSRTRTERLGPLVAAGPFRWVRNPLYIGNIALWLGFALAARLPWLLLPVAALLGLEYHAIVRWEEQLLEKRLGASYRAYAARVPRWLPRFGAAATGDAVAPGAFSWRETLYSERGTLIAIAAGLALLWAKDSV